MIQKQLKNKSNLSNFSHIAYNKTLNIFIKTFDSQIKIQSNNQSPQVLNSLSFAETQNVQKIKFSKCDSYLLIITKSKIFILQFSILKIILQLPRFQKKISHFQFSANNKKTNIPQFIGLLTEDKILTIIQINKNIQMVIKDVSIFCFSSHQQNLFYCFKQRQLYKYVIEFKKADELIQKNKKIDLQLSKQEKEHFRNFKPLYLIQKEQKFYIVGFEKISIQKKSGLIKIIVFNKNFSSQLSFNSKKCVINSDTLINIEFYLQNLILIGTENPNQIILFQNQQILFQDRWQQNPKGFYIISKQKNNQLMIHLQNEIIKHVLIENELLLQNLPTIKKTMSFAPNQFNSKLKFQQFKQLYCEYMNLFIKYKDIQEITQQFLYQLESIKNNEKIWKVKKQAYIFQQIPIYFQSRKINIKSLPKIIQLSKLFQYSPFSKNNNLHSKINFKIQQLSTQIQNLSINIANFSTYHQSSDSDDQIYFSIKCQNKQLHSKKIKPKSQIQSYINNKHKQKIQSQFLILRIPYVKIDKTINMEPLLEMEDF